MFDTLSAIQLLSGCLSLPAKNKCPPALLIALALGTYDASLCITVYYQDHTAGLIGKKYILM